MGIESDLRHCAWQAQAAHQDRPRSIATAIFDALVSMPADFMQDGREDTPPQDRDSL
jgi:hypothetical protein